MNFSGRISPSFAALFRLVANSLLTFLLISTLADQAIALPVNGVCSIANNGQSVDTPATGLCTAGTPSAVSGIGPWSWTCAGSGGGSDASCSAVQAGGVFYKSSDAGLNWTGKATGIGFNSPIEALAASPAYASDHTLFLGSGGGVYKSTNSGDNWTMVQSGYSVKALAISPAFATDRTIFSGQMLAGAYKSTDAGATWSAANTGLASTQVRALAISPNFAGDQTIFAAILGNGIYKSTNGGTSWVTANSGIATLTGQSLAISPTYSSDQTIFVANTDNSIYRSSDGGASWIHTDSGLSGAIFRVVISPSFSTDQTLFTATSSGIYKSTDSGNSWTLTKTAVGQTQLAISPVYGSDQTLFAGIYGDNVYTSSTGGNSWSPSSSNFATIRQLSALGISPAFAVDRNVFAAAYFAGPVLTVSYPLTFGNVTIGTASAVKQAAIINGMFGDANLAINSITLSGTDAAQYSILPGTCGSMTPTLVKGGQCTIDVQFIPTSSGSKSAAIQINSNAVMSPDASITLSGSGVTASSIITSPTTGFYTNGTSLAVSGSASCISGESIAKVEVSADGGSTWQAATGTTSWSANILTVAAGSYTIKSRATTVSGFVETPGSGISVTVDRTPPTGTLFFSSVWTLDAKAMDGDSCLMVYPNICGQLEMSTNGVNWQPATTTPGTGGPLWLRDRAGNMTILNGGTTYNLSVTVSGTGTVHSTPATDINCSGSCNQSFAANSLLALTATPGSGYIFSGWSGACSGTGSCSVTMNQVRGVVALFTYALPGAPTSATAAAGNGQSTVSFAAPASNGGSAISSYTVTSSPGSITATGPASPITIIGLTNGTAYTFTVTATNATGTGAASSPSSSVTPTSGLTASSTISSPATGYYTNSTSVAVSGTATCNGGCTVSLVEVSADNGVTWQAATGTTSWNASISVPTAKSYIIKSRATTNEGIVEVPAGSITVTVERQAPTGTLALYYGAWTLNASANDGGMCLLVYPSICGLLEMSFNGSSWQTATTTPGSSGPLWLRDRAGNTAYLGGGSVANSNGGPLRIDGGGYYSFLQHALNDAGSGNTIKLTSTALSENLTLSNNAALTIKGGYDSNLGSVTGTTPLNGNLAVQAGSLTIENIAITGTMTIGSGSVNVTNLTIK